MGHTDEEKNTWYKHWLKVGFDALEKQLLETAGTYCFENQVTMADLCLIPQVYNANRFNLDMGTYPTINRINQTCLELDAFKDAVPENQADAN
jgi:maleylacetoacetate isomerase